MLYLCSRNNINCILISAPIIKAIAGAVSSILVFIVVQGFYNLVKKNKTRRRTSSNESPVTKASPDVCRSVDNQVEMQKCPICGKYIEQNSVFCRFCGSKIMSNKVTFNKTQRKLLHILTNFVSFLVGIFISATIGYAIYLFVDSNTTDLVNVYSEQYILPPIFAYLIFSIISILSKLGRKPKSYRTISFAILFLIVIGCWSYFGCTDMFLQKEREKNILRINRTFIDCSLGEDLSSVESKIRRKKISFEERDVRGRKLMIMRNIEYGKYTLDSLGFAFFNDRMYKATMFFHISSFEDFEKDLTYHELIKLFDEKYLRYSQGYIYTDDSTQIECSHNTSNNFNTYVVAVSYYDKKSGSHEDFQKGF